MADFDKIKLLPIDQHFLENTICPDALAIMIIDRLHKQIPTSVVRTADGERIIITENDWGKFLSNPKWLQKYGLAGIDFEKLRQNLLWAGNNATFLSCSPSGLCEKHRVYRTNDLFNQRDKYISHFFTTFWKSANRVEDVLQASKNGVFILHREFQTICDSFSRKYKVECSGFKLDSWKDHEAARKAVSESKCGLVLVSGGASGKALIVSLANDTGKVVVDVGEAMQSIWAQ